MADEKQLNAVRFFCRNTISNTGQFNHDWNDLIQQVSYFDIGQIQKDAALVQAVARRVRKEFPNGENWNNIVNAQGAHETILTIIRSGLAALLKAEPVGASTST